MPSIDDVYNQLIQINTNLQGLHADLVGVQDCCQQGNVLLSQLNSTLNAGFVNMSQGFQALIAIGEYADQALLENDQQNTTIICLLDKIAREACSLLNEAHIQTRLQTTIEVDSEALVQLYESAHPDAALELERQRKLVAQVRECCPPEPEPPACVFEPCPEPPQVPEPLPEPEYQGYEPQGGQQVRRGRAHGVARSALRSGEP